MARGVGYPSSVKQKRIFKGNNMSHPMATQLEGKAAIVTGSGRGIGRGIALVLGSRGAAIGVCDVNESDAEAVADEINSAGGRALSGYADVTSKESIGEFTDRAISEFGAIDISVGNAGVIGAPGFADRRDYTDADWDATYGINVRGLVNTAEAIIPHMSERRSGRIINISSHGGRSPGGFGRPGSGTVGMPYSVSKAAAIQWTHALAIKLGELNITVNVVCPGTLWTPMWQTIAFQAHRHQPDAANISPREYFDRQIARTVPLGRSQTPTDIGHAVAFFASEDASEITGQALNVNGGTRMN